MNTSSSISNIENYLDEFLFSCKKITKVCEDILDLKPVKGLDKYSKELLALTLEKKIIMSIEQFHIDKQKASFWRDAKVIAPVTYNKNNFLKNYINLFVHNFFKQKDTSHHYLHDINKFYNEIIDSASKEFRNRLFVLPNSEKVSVGDLQIAIHNVLNIPVNRTISIKKKTGNLKNVAAIAGLTTSLTIGMLSQQKEVDIFGTSRIEKMTEIDNDISFKNTPKNLLGKEEIAAITSVAAIPSQITIEKKFIGYDNGCPIEHQEYMYEMAEKYDIPFNVLMTIVDYESRGNFDNNGVESDTDDYGICQINICNHDTIYEKFGYDSNEILNDYKKNIEAGAYLISEICKKYPEEVALGNYENVFGAYNGWLNWKSKPTSIDYAADAVMKYNTIYNKTDEELYGYEVIDEKSR